jgi:hypothetical protein
MKKILFVFVLVAIIATGTAFADYPSGFGIGVQGGFGGTWGGGTMGGAALSLKIPSVPIFWAVQAGFGSEQFWLNVTGDYYLIHNPLVSSIGLHWYFGLGLGVGLGIGDPFRLGAEFRVPVGLSWQPLDFLELYLQAVPSIGLRFLGGPVGLWGGWGGNFGLRFWL